MRRPCMVLLASVLFLFNSECFSKKSAGSNELLSLASKEELQGFCPDERVCEEKDYVGIWSNVSGSSPKMEFLADQTYHFSHIDTLSSQWIESPVATWSFVARDQSVNSDTSASPIRAKFYKILSREDKIKDHLQENEEYLCEWRPPLASVIAKNPNAQGKFLISLASGNTVCGHPYIKMKTK